MQSNTGGGNGLGQTLENFLSLIIRACLVIKSVQEPLQQPQLVNLVVKTR